MGYSSRQGADGLQLADLDLLFLGPLAIRDIPVQDDQPRGLASVIQQNDPVGLDMPDRPVGTDDAVLGGKSLFPDRPGDVIPKCPVAVFRVNTVQPVVPGDEGVPGNAEHLVHPVVAGHGARPDVPIPDAKGTRLQGQGKPPFVLFQFLVCFPNRTERVSLEEEKNQDPHHDGADADDDRLHNEMVYGTGDLDVRHRPACIMDRGTERDQRPRQGFLGLGNDLSFHVLDGPCLSDIVIEPVFQDLLEPEFLELPGFGIPDNEPFHGPCGKCKFRVHASLHVFIRDEEIAQGHADGHDKADDDNQDRCDSGYGRDRLFHFPEPVTRTPYFQARARPLFEYTNSRNCEAATGSFPVVAMMISLASG